METPAKTRNGITSYAMDVARSTFTLSVSCEYKIESVECMYGYFECPADVKVESPLVFDIGLIPEKHAEFITIWLSKNELSAPLSDKVVYEILHQSSTEYYVTQWTDLIEGMISREYFH